MSAPDRGRRAEPARRPIPTIAAVLLGLITIAAVLAWLFWLPRWIETPRVSIGTVTRRSLGGAVGLSALGLAVYSLYAVGAAIVARGRIAKHALLLIWLGGTATSLLLVWAYPVTSTDVFDYFFRSRMTLRYGANPYLALPNQYKFDPLLRHIGWPNAPSAYGPLWEQLSLLLVILGGNVMPASILLYKILSLASYLLSGAALAALIDDRQQRGLGLYLWLLSPLVLWELVGAGHNDGLLVLSLLLALLAARRRRFWAAVLVLAIGTLVKFLPALFVPLVVLRWMRAKPTWRQRVAVIGAALMLCVLPAIVAYAPYWDLPPSFSRMSPAAQLAAIWDGGDSTLRNLAVRANFLNASPLAVISYLFQTPSGLDILNRVLAPTGTVLADKTDVRALVSGIGNALLLVGLAWQSWQVWFRQRPLPSAFLSLLLWYVLVCSQWFQPWYLVWLLPLVALQPHPRWLAGLTLWSMTAQASYLLQYIVLPNWRINGQTLQAQLLYLGLIYGPPLLFWLLTARVTRSGRLAPRSDTLTSPQ